MSILTPTDPTDPPGEGEPPASPLDETFMVVGAPLPTIGEGERSIPVRSCDLISLLAAEPDLAPSESSGLRQLARMLKAVFHYEFHDWLLELKALYDPIDPDTDTLTIPGLDPGRAPVVSATREGVDAESGDDHASRFLGAFAATLARANFVPLDLPELEKAIATPNDLGLDYEPDLKLFEHLRVYVRGQAKITRVIRNAHTMFRKKTVVYDAYRRVIIALKFKPGKEFDEYVRGDVVYLRMFKDVPYVDMDMHLPEHGTRVKMRMIDKLQIASPVVTGIPTLAIKLFAASFISIWMVPALLAVPIGAGLKSFFGYRTARQKYLHHMIRHLYYLTMANNASVITRVVDSGEEEEFKEALLAYYFLWRGMDDPEPWDHQRLDQKIEAYLRERAGVDINFEIGDALNKIDRLGLIRRNSQGYLSAIPIDDALRVLDEQWDHFFRYA